MSVVFGLLGFVLIGIGAAVGLDAGAAGRRYLTLIARTAHAPGSVMPRWMRRVAGHRSRTLRIVTGAGLVLVGVAWVVIATLDG